MVSHKNAQIFNICQYLPVSKSWLRLSVQYSGVFNFQVRALTICPGAQHFVGGYCTTISKKKLSPGDTTILAFVAIIIMTLINHLALSINGGLISLNKKFFIKMWITS